MVVYRLIDLQHAGLVLDGASAALTGGRWNPRGCAVLYTSLTVSLALLELMSHYQQPLTPTRWCLATLRLPRDAVERFDRALLPPRWRGLTQQTQQIGGHWLRHGNLAMQVPSVIHGFEDNVLVNPAHPGFPKLRLEAVDELQVATDLLPDTLLSR